MATPKQLEEFEKRKREGMVRLKTQQKRQEQMKDPKIQKRQQNAKLAAEIASYAIPGLGVAKVGKMLVGKGPAFIKRVRAALNQKDNKDALEKVFGITKKVGPPKGKGSNLVTPRFRKKGAKPISKAAQKKAKRTRTALATTAAGATALTLGPEKSKKGKQPLIEAGEVGPAPKITAAETAAKPVDSAPKKTTKADDPTEGGRYAFYPGKTSKDLGLMYEVDKDKMSDEVRERLEEEILYEGDYKGGRVGKGKKMKMKKGGLPKGCGKARRGYGKAMMGGGMVKTKRKYSGGGRLY